MKLQQIVLENFGIYARKRFELDAAPLVLIYGPNESGKTTALNGIRQGLFGFPLRTRYLTSRGMSAEVRAEMRNGSQLEFRRRKGRRDEVVGTLSGKRLGGEDVSGLLAHLDLESYEQLFGFSLEELRSGESSLKNARLSDALAGGGLGGITALQDLRDSLSESLTELYKPRRPTSIINLKLKEIQRCHESLRATQILPSKVDDIRQELHAQQERSQELKRQYAATYTEIADIQRTLDALPKCRALKAIQTQLDQLELPDNIDLSLLSRWEECERRLKDTSQRVTEERKQIAFEEQRLLELKTDASWFEFELQIESRGHQGDEVADLRSQCLDLQTQLKEAEAICARLLESLELNATDQRLRDFKLGDRLRRELENSSQQFIKSSQEIVKITAKLEAATATRDQLRSHLCQQDVPANLAELLVLVEQLRLAENELTQGLADLESKLRDRELLGLQEALTETVRQTPQPEWTVPAADEVSELRDLCEETQRQQEFMLKNIERCEHQLQAARRDLQGMEQGSRTAEDLARMHSLAQQRDQLIEGWLDQLALPLAAPALGADQQRERLSQLRLILSEIDRLHESSLARSSAFAAFQQRQEMIHEQEQQLENFQHTQQELRKQRETLQSRWLTLWSECPFAPGSPECMQAWLEKFLKWRELTALAGAVRQSVHVTRGVVRNMRMQLQDVWPDNLQHEFSLTSIEEHIRSWQSLQRDEQRDRQRLDAAELECNRLAQELRNMRSDQQELLNRYQQWLKQCPVESWPLDQVGTLFDCIDQLRREDANALRIRQQLQEKRKRILDYERAVAALAQELSLPFDGERAEQLATGWLRRLQKMREDRSEQIRLQASVGHRTRVVAELVEQQAALSAQQAEITSVTGEASLEVWTQRAHQAEKLRGEYAELRAAVDAYAGREPVNDYMDRLIHYDEAEKRLCLEERARELQQLDESRKSTDEQVGSLTQQIEQMADSHAAQQHQHRLHGLRGELAELAEQWVVERIATELLSRTVERFAAAHEPELLQLAREYFRKLTGGRYVTIEHDHKQTGSFCVRNAADESFPPDRLSTGTREQLYLAIRMAFIAHHNHQHEPLPVIMDDCFVNFDDARTRHALEVVSDWDDSTQTLLLSCHWRIVQLLAEIAPGTRMIHMENDFVGSVGEFTAEHSVQA